MGHALFCVGKRVREIIHRVYTPFVAGLVVLDMSDAVNHRVTHIEVGRRHIDFGAQHFCAVFEFAGGHAAEQVEIFFDAAVAVRAVFAGLGERAAVFADFIGAQIVDISQTFFNKLYGTFINEIKIARSVKALIPLKAEPLNILLNRLDIFHIFFLRVGVVKAQVANAAVFFRGAEIDANRFCVADMQIAVGFRRETGLYVVVNPFF